MPNWCDNYVEVSHKDRSRMVLLRRAFRQGRMLSYIHPIPDDLQITAGRLGSDDNPEQIALRDAEQRNRGRYGYANWYDFCVGEWGTKWDVGERGGDSKTGPLSLSLSFQSAWAPPIQIYEKMKDMGYEVHARYHEPGMCFVGAWEDGTDIYFDYSGCDSQTVRDIIGDDLDDFWAISESMAQYEEEDRWDEELYQWTIEGAEKKLKAKTQPDS